jgi:hypothetical protein
VSKAQKPLTAAQIVKLRGDVDALQAQFKFHTALHPTASVLAEDFEHLKGRVEELSQSLGQVAGEQAKAVATPEWVGGVNEALVDAAKRLREVEERSHEEAGLLSLLRVELNASIRRLAAVERRTFWQWLWGTR